MRLLPQVDHFLTSLNIMEDMTMKLEDIISLAKAGYKPSDIKELVKQFKRLPYDSGVAMGFSMILDDTKLIEDAFNEASIQMRDNKESEEDKNDKKI